MDIYLFCLILGVVGLGAMAISGLGRHGGGSHAQGHGSHGAHGHAVGHGHGFGPMGLRATAWMLTSPRFLFAGLLGFGLIGVALHSVVGGAVLLASALAGGVLIERLVVAPVWRFSMRFASRAANTLESATFAEATVVSNFDRNGQGIISLEVDGHVQQVLATLAPADLAKGTRIRAGQLVRVDEVDAARQRCTVSAL